MAADSGFLVETDVPLAPLSTFGVGGAASAFTRVSQAAQVMAAHGWAATRGRNLFVLGGGSNLIIADEGVDALVLRVEIAGIEFTEQDGTTLMRAGAGERWDNVVAQAVARGLGGIECLSGIPGSVGGTPIQNVGAYGQEVAETIESVDVFDRATGTVTALESAACRFSYRMSRFKQQDAGRFIVLAVTFRLTPGAASSRYPDVVAQLAHERIATPSVGDLRAAVLAVRRRKGMVLDDADPDTRSVGSFFMNPIVTSDAIERVASVAGDTPTAFPLTEGRVKLPAAWLIERAGFQKGFVDGAVAISSKHPLALVNRGGATARDVLRLATHIKRVVRDRFDVALRPEPIFIGFDNHPAITYLQSEI